MESIRTAYDIAHGETEEYGSHLWLEDYREWLENTAREEGLDFYEYHELLASLLA
jgi:hypothetical protein